MRSSFMLSPRSWIWTDWRRIALVPLAGILLCALLLRSSDRWSDKTLSILDVRT